MSDQNPSTYAHQIEKSVLVSASQLEVFNFIDNHKQFSGHMNESSWMMGGSKMMTQIDSGLGQSVGSHITMTARVFGLEVSLDEVITLYNKPSLKRWQTVGTPKLIVIGDYEMGVELRELGNQTQLKIFINYNLPPRNRWLGVLFGRIYATWCVQSMSDGVLKNFSPV